MDPLSISLLIGAGTSLLSGILGSNAADKAAKTQADAAGQALDFQKQVYADSQAKAAPWLAAGKTALDSYVGELGLSDAAKNGTFQSGFTTTPGYEFQVEQGNKGVVNNLRALGLGGSGAAMKALSRFNEGLAGTTYGQYLDRLSALEAGGQSQVNTSNSTNMQGAQVIGQGITDRAAATASGYVGGANAITGALGNFANNAGVALGGYDQNWNRIAANSNATPNYSQPSNFYGDM